MQRDGLFIALEGSDGSGKTTQIELLQRRLELAGYNVIIVKFPQYDQPSSYFITQYLNGKYGTLDQVGPYTAALFYALDRYNAAQQIRAALEAGNIVLADRFVGSNMAHQGAKISHPEERRGFFVWLDNLEFRLLEIPRPDYSFVLRLPAAVAQERIGQKNKRDYTNATHDLHEANFKHLELTTTVYDDMCRLFPRDFVRIDCSRDNHLLSIEQVHELLWGKVVPLLPAHRPNPVVAQASPTNVTPFYKPAALDAKTKELYLATMHELLNKQAAIAAKLTSHLETKVAEAEAKQQAQTVAELLLPVAALTQAQDIQGDQQDADSIVELQRTYSNESEPVSLVAYWPRNELDIVPYLVYRQSNQSFKDTARNVSDWPYEKKANTLRSALQSPRQRPTLKLLTYTWDIISDYRTFLQLRSARPDAPYTRQSLTPRLGYDIPQVIEAAGLADDFQRCFDTSLNLYSALQAAGYEREAEYATLIGHRMRWETSYSFQDILFLVADKRSEVSQLLHTMIGELAEVHTVAATTILARAASKEDKREHIGTPTSKQAVPKPAPHLDA